ncbi:hypothetical protein KR018_007398 [Drosophila ironensis]|nr:hypothetical protein KR018_007398 [Drosophila ironensis]
MTFFNLSIFVTILIPYYIGIYCYEYNFSNHDGYNADGSIYYKKWKRNEMMDSNGLYWLQWWINVDEAEIIFEVCVNTRGFIGLGFSKDGRMSGADMVLLWVDDITGTPNALDCHGSKHPSNAAPLQDDTQNYYIINGNQNITHTNVKFRRKFETCDPFDIPFTVESLKVIWAFGDRDPIHGNLRGHGQNRGFKSMHLFSSSFQKDSILMNGQGNKKWDITVTNVTVEPSMDTLYWCKIVKTPEVSGKQHIIGYEALLSQSSNASFIRNLVYRMTLFECHSKSYPGSEPASWDIWVKSSGTICNSNLLTPRDWDSCSTPVAFWSPGSKGQFLPLHAGIPMGGRTEVKYYMLEIHYDNPNGKRTMDNSGFRIHYTSNLRINDAGIMISGVSISDTQIIPPGQTLYRNVGICGPSCSSMMFPENGIKLISAALHSHKAGRKLSLRHVRAARELKRIIEDENYDYKNQQTYELVNETIILPGDYLITDCAYDTKLRNRPLFGGYSTKHEMCLSFITYYPKIELSGCYSMTPVREFFEMFGVLQFHSLNMTDIENLFLYNGNIYDYVPNEVYSKIGNNNVHINQEDIMYTESLLNKLIISEPLEFHDRSFLSHLIQLPWHEPLFTKRVEQEAVGGKHMTFCRVSNDSISIVS